MRSDLAMPIRCGFALVVAPASRLPVADRLGSLLTDKLL